MMPPTSPARRSASRAASPCMDDSTMENYRDILFDVRDGVARITINRPEKYNAFTAETCEELIDVASLCCRNCRKCRKPLVACLRRVGNGPFRTFRTFRTPNSAGLTVQRCAGRRFGQTNPTGVLAKRTQQAFWPNEPNRRFGQTNPTGILAKRTQRLFWRNEPNGRFGGTNPTGVLAEHFGQTNPIKLNDYNVD